MRGLPLRVQSGGTAGVSGFNQGKPRLSCPEILFMMEKTFDESTGRPNEYR